MAWGIAWGLITSLAQAQTQTTPGTARAAAPARSKVSNIKVIPADVPPADAPPPAGEPEAPPGAIRPAQRAGAASLPPRDAEVVPAAAGPEAEAEAVGDGGNPLPGAKEPPPGSGGGASPDAGGGDPATPYVLRPDRLSPEKQQVKLSVEVRSPRVVNLNKSTPVRIVVTNDGSTDAYDVRVVYQLPESLQFESSETKADTSAVNPQIYIFKKPTMAAGGEWSIGLKVIPKDTKTCDHVAQVTAAVGTKSQVMIQEPKLRVEAVPSPSRILKGGQVKFKITVSNPGTGPARNVNVKAKLSDGLRLGEDDEVEQTIDLIKPAETVELEPLLLDTVAGGQQKCDIKVESPDVNFVPADHRITRTVDVTRPELTVDLTGADFRYTGQSLDYKLTVTNTGTASAKQVLISAALPPQGGKLARGPIPSGGTWSGKDRKILWKIPQLEPGQTVDYAFTYETSTVGQYRCVAEATSGPLRASKTLSTEVQGIADLDLKVEQTDRVIDAGKKTYYDFIIKNVGSKEATKLALSGTLVNVEVSKPYFDELYGKFEFTKTDANLTSQFSFPIIPTLAAGATITLSLEVTALKGGKASATVSLGHDEMGDGENSKIKGAITTTVTDRNRPAPRSASSSP